MGVEILKNYPIIMSHLRRKIAAKRRIKVTNNIPDDLTYDDVEQIMNSALKTINKNLPDLKDKYTTTSLKDEMEKTGVAAEIGLRSSEINLKPTGEPKQELKVAVPIEEVVVEEEEVIEAPVEEVSAIPAPMPQIPSYKPAAPPVKSSPQLGGTKLWDVSFWGDQKIW
jgi:hypothetical protein